MGEREQHTPGPRLSPAQQKLLAKMAADPYYVPRATEWRTEDALRAHGFIFSVPRDNGGIGSRAVLTDAGRAAISKATAAGGSNG